MKKLIAIFVLLITLCIGQTVFAADIKVSINLAGIDFNDVKPQIINGRVMVPMRTIFEKLGATILWEPDTKTVVAIKDGTTVILAVNSTIAKVNGTEVKLDSPATLISDRTVVPVRFISEALGAKVYWNTEKRWVDIYTKDNISKLSRAGLSASVESQIPEVISTSLGDIEVTNTVIESSSEDISYEYYILSSINQYTVNQILKDSEYTDEQKENFKNEIRQYIKKVADYVIDISFDSCKFGGSYIIQDGFKDADEKEPLYKYYYSWSNYNPRTGEKDNQGFRWCPDADSEVEYFND